MPTHMGAARFSKLIADTGAKVDLADATGGFFLRVQTKTGDYTVTTADSGSIFTTTGATGAVNFTLPTHIKKGFVAWFACGADQNMTVTAGTAGTLVLFNDLEGNSLAYSTSSEKIGALAMVFSDGSKYFCVNLSDANTDTPAT